MNFVDSVKRSLNRFAKSRGYRIEKVVDYGDATLDIFPVLVEALEPASSNFFFVEVGANDGCSGDPIHDQICSYGWRGLLLEPQPSVFEKLVKNYSGFEGLIFENVALGTADGTQKLYTFEDADYLASFDRKTLEKRSHGNTNIKEIDVKVKTFQTLYSEHQVDRVDLLLVDTEGFDFEVIKMALDTGLAKPRLIRYEHLHLTSSERAACISLLAKCGYKMLRDGRDTIALHCPKDLA